MSGRWFRRSWLWFWLRTRWRRGRGTVWIAAGVSVGLILLLIGAVDTAARPVLADLASARAQNQVTGIISQAVEEALAEEPWDYENVIRIQTGGSGQITAMTTDTAALNRLRTSILDAVTERVDALGAEQLGIPLGSLTGLPSLSGWGPQMPVRVAAAASAGAEFEHVFTAAGINQTLHRVMLNVHVAVRLLVPGGTVETQVDTQVCVAETVIVGEVPGTYLELP